MLKYKMQSTKDLSEASIKKVVEQIHMEKISFILYFASAKFDFQKVNQIFHKYYPDVTVVGGTSQGELTSEGYSDGNLTAISVYGDDFKVETLVLEEIKRKGMLYKNAVREKVKSFGINLSDPHMKDKFFGISLIDALSVAEEKLSLMLSNAFDEKEIHLVGGSCGCLDTSECYLSCNGEVYQDAAILLLVRTNKKIMVYNENIYEPVGKKHRVTSADISQRIVKNIDGQPAAKVYAKELGVTESQLKDDIFAAHPIGRTIGEKSYIASPVCTVPGEGIKFYIRVMPGSSFRFMQAVDSFKKAQETAAQIKAKVDNPQLIFGFSCILRYIQFLQQNSTQTMYQELRNIAPVFGITTLGEQIGLNPVNQTLTLLAIAD